ncbi:Alanyl-tRNA synthetase AlaS [Helicobacter sp. NHP19-012]|uniref:Alanine--tRNA ligase n=1 Tax=Helicobacter gastrofelis TaxID=2849642 RepID=A0ABM7SG04_9HELI|nr:alanine--tRNA ligase [Helicobacter sp. NHP19-012]BCZ19787.1 Alanyl-tRNA synthetase AlaS [Helicobacter sp. NHP19-012]
MEIKKAFLGYFEGLGHLWVPSSSLVPQDSSLLFTNAGMVQFKDIFLGKTKPFTNRATSAQLCMRAGGKHNDLENVGYTNRHHTLFEMLGNFSFFDYFKEEAIAYAFEFVHKHLGFDKESIYISVHEKDQEAYKLWQKFIPHDRIKTMGDKDNFWQMADTGPCGYCSEIYIDQGEKYFHSKEDYFGGEGDRFLEIWNLVFMQYDRSKEGVLTPLEKPCIDTGMGLERVQALLEGVQNNFDSSLFKPLMACIEKSFGLEYAKHKESFRVLADHARSVAFLLGMGVYFENTGRGYVLRRILRRALRHGYLLQQAKGRNLESPFFYEILGHFCDLMLGYPLLKEHQESIKAECKAEEELFLATLDKGMHLFEKALTECKGSAFSGAVAFKLYDTYGFPLDLTADMLRGLNLQVDMQEYQACMQEQKQRSAHSFRQSNAKDGLKALDLSHLEPNHFAGYTTENLQTQVVALYPLEDNTAYIVLKDTPFYPQGGGPIGDKGVLLDPSHVLLAKVLDTQKVGGVNASLIELEPGASLKEGDGVVAKVSDRAEIAKHHSATHLLHLALRTILTESARQENKNAQIQQKGSYIEPHRLRFDFSFYRNLSDEELEQIESFVNAKISEGATTCVKSVGANEARESGAVMLFEDKYLDEVRLVDIAGSLEACGGVHVPNSANIGGFAIVKSSGVSAGVRRIEAVCGRAYYAFIASERRILKQARTQLKTQDLLKALKHKEQAPKSTPPKEPTLTPIEGQVFHLATLSGLKEHLSHFLTFIEKYKSRQEPVVALFQYHNLQKNCVEVVLKSVGGHDVRPLLEALKAHSQSLGYASKGGGRADHASLVLSCGGDFNAQDLQDIQEALHLKALEVLKP